MSELPPERPIPMNDAKRRYFSGDTLQQALVQAANYFNLDPSYVAYRSLEKKHGFLKTRRKVVIEVDPENPRRETPVSVPAATRTLPPPVPSAYRTRPEAGPLPQADVEDVEGDAQPAAAPPPPAPVAQEARPPREPRGDRGGNRGERGDRGGRGERPGGERGGERPRRRERDFAPRSPRLPEAEPFRPAAGSPQVNPEGELVTLPERPRGISERYPEAAGPMGEAAAKAAALLVRLAGLDLKPRVFQGEERLEVDLVGEDVDWCFADDGEILMAIEHLMPRMIRSLSGGETTPVRVDCDNFHEIREERLRSLAQRVAEEVRKRGKPRVLEPMNPGDRRIIHTTLADDPNVVTESEGDGYFKRIMVRPA
jgi:spoIIIJ-associated protein